MGLIFISHSSRDNAEAVAMRDWLAGQGWGDVFLDYDVVQEGVICMRLGHVVLH